MKERLQKLIAAAGLASRRQAEEWIRLGRVTVNGRPAHLGQSADPASDRVAVDGREISIIEEKITVMVNKPRGYVCTLDDPEGRRLVTELVKDIPARLFPVGRLDYNSEGLLLLTNDGDLAHTLMHPSRHVEKTYLVKVRGQVTEQMAATMRSGIQLEDGMTAPARVEKIRMSGTHSWFELTLGEGRNRQVRRMCNYFDLTVARLIRIRVGHLTLDDLVSGHYRRLTPAELKKFGRRT